MKPTNLLFSFEDLGTAKDKALKTLSRLFAQAGSPVASASADGKTRRSSGVSYRELALTFADSQTATFRIKQTGDVYEVLLNGSAVPVKNQGDQVKAVAEVAAMMDKGRVKFQQKLAKAAVKIPKEIHTAAPRLAAALTQKRDGLKEAVAAADGEIAAWRDKLAA